jgi:hypothetical protein
MKKNTNPHAPLFTWLALAVGGILLVQNAAAQASGAIHGHVSNAGTNVYLDGAQVTLQPSGRTAITAREGEFIFSGVPAGVYQVTVTYTGLQPETATVSVSDGTTATRDFPLTSEIYRLGEFVVAGDREGTARAIQLQRYAPNVKNILASDAFGNIPWGPASPAP